MVRLLQHHILNLHQANLRTPLVFIELHRNILDVLLGFRDNHMLKRIDAPARFFNFTPPSAGRTFHTLPGAAYPAGYRQAT